jgi:hypothetical protein
VVDSAAAALYLALSGVAPGGQTDSTPSAASTVMAARAPAEISLDGILSEPGWAAATPVSRFTHREPDEGAPATERTEVRILYDNDALYVGGRLFNAGAHILMITLSYPVKFLKSVLEVT